MTRRRNLRELKDVAQPGNGLYKRWFSSDEADLFTWQSGETVGQFEFCFGKPETEYSVRWHSDHGFEYARIDSGDEAETHKQSPVLQDISTLDPVRVRAAFNNVAGTLDDAVREFVWQHLQQL